MADRTKNVFGWYEGTADLAEPVKPEAFRRLGDLAPSDGPWYRPEHLAVSPGSGLNPSSGMPSEGIGEGWFYSVLGGGARLRPVGQRTVDNGQLSQAKGIRKDVGFDNTSSGRMRGDYAVPTLFDGNFDAIAPGTGVPTSTGLIPGWDAAQSKLVNVYDTTLVPTLQGHFDKLGVDRSQPNYAVKLNAGDSISHNGFVTPDWGTLRFDLHTTNDVQKGSSLGQLKVFLDEVGAAASTTPIQFIDLQEAEGTADQYSADRWRIGYGETGFETFTIDVPDALRGKVATLRFELSGGEVFVDNVFFKSQHLLLGNPTLNGQEARPNVSTNANNFLIERAQYAISYNPENKGSNWASYQINKSWLGTNKDRFYWAEDPGFPLTGAIEDNTYDSTFYTVGHLTDRAIRNRSTKDISSTFLYSNSLPQAPSMNGQVWASFEQYLRGVANSNREVYVITGGRGNLNDDPNWTDLLRNDSVFKAGVTIPSHFWKVAIVLDRTGISVGSLKDENGGGIIDVIAVDIPNDLTDPQVDSQNWQQWKKLIDLIESLTGLDFLSNLSDDVENRIEAKKDFQIYIPATPLLAEKTAGLSLQNSELLFNSSVGHYSLVNNNFLDTEHEEERFGIFKIGSREVSEAGFSLKQICPNQLSSSEIRLSQIGSSQAGVMQGSSFQDSASKIYFTQVGGIQSSVPESGSNQVSSGQISSSQVSSSQVSSNQVSSFQVDSNKSALNQSSFSQTRPTEISLSSSITLQQFLSSHNFSLQNTTIPTWIEFLTGTTPFNLNIEITDLPTGQLAEANITYFDPTGRPTSGTLTLDTDANGLGWF